MAAKSKHELHVGKTTVRRLYKRATLDIILQYWMSPPNITPLSEPNGPSHFTAKYRNLIEK